VLAGLFPIYGIYLLRLPLIWENLLPLAVLTLATALVYYVIESGLISIAVGLSEKSSIRLTWRRQFGWTVLFYITLCLIGLFMAIAASDLKGIAGIFVFALPLVLMHYVQREYIERTKASASEVERMNKELTQANHAILQASLEIEQLNDELFVTLAKIIDARDPQVLDHAVKVAGYATRVAREMDLPAERIERIRQAALLHDIGKIGIAEQILKKPGQLSGLEYESIKTHTTMGSDFLEASRGLRHLSSFVRHHHEWWDGKGYPDKLTGEQSPLEARIIAVADAVDSMASARPYHEPMNLDEIVAEVIRCAGTQFDPMIADIYIRVLRRDGLGMVVDPVRPAKRTADRRPSGSVSAPAAPKLAISPYRLGMTAALVWNLIFR
jgi:putative nucleotidyltransferase with HDIG domain